MCPSFPRFRLAAVLIGLLFASSQSGCFLVGYDGIFANGDSDDDPDAASHLPPGADANSEEDADKQVRRDGSVDAGSRDGSHTWPSEDASDLPDGGRDADAEASHDAGEDGGPQGDGGHASDAGPNTDGGAPSPDSGLPLDASAGQDAGPPKDAGELDAGPAVDAGLDGGQSVEPDGGPWWEDVPPTKPCTSAWWCGQQCTPAASPCVFECSATSCTPTCQASTTCYAECQGGGILNGTSCAASCGAGADCTYRCSSLQCSSACAAGSTCELDCQGATSCVVECAPGAHCMARCNALTCNMACSGAAMTCPGGVLTCDRPCP